MGYLKKIAAGAVIAGALTATGLPTAVANADDWGYGPGYGYGGPGYGWAGGPGYGNGPGYGYGGACAFIPPFVSQWVPPAVCGG
jgi:hypothetical protein